MAADEVAAGQLAKLHPKEGPGRLIELSGIEVLLDDLGRRARRKGIAFRGQVGAGYGLRNGRQLRGNNVHRLKPAAHRRTTVRRGGHRHEAIGAVHRVDGEDISHPVHHGDGAGEVARFGFRRHLTDDLLYLRGGQARRRIGAGAIAGHRRRRGCAARRHGPTALLGRDFRALATAAPSAAREGQRQ